MEPDKVNLAWEILDKKRLELLPKLEFLKDEGFYLAGGTALSIQIKHRTSVDFDFYKQGEFNSDKILLEFQRRSKKIVLLQNIAHTLIVRMEDVEVSLFSYPYELLNRLIETNYLNLASVEDIAAMKLVAIVQRGIQRDFIDLYFLIKRLGLARIFQLTQEKYPPFNKYTGLQAITYFVDADVLSEKKLIVFKSIPWQEIKDFIVDEAKKNKKKLER